jgi:hypothetical protein
MGNIRSNLPNDSQPWGKDIEDRLTSAESTIISNEVNNSARDAQLQTSINAVSDALVQVKTAIASDHKRYDFSGGSLPTRPTVLTFTKPIWATKATVISTVYATASASSLSVSGDVGLFIDGNSATYKTYDWNYAAPIPQIINNTKYLSAYNSTGSVTITDSTSVTLSGNTLNVWASFAKTLTNEIPPDDINNWSQAQIDRWNVGLSGTSSCSVEIVSTVIWTTG